MFLDGHTYTRAAQEQPKYRSNPMSILMCGIENVKKEKKKRHIIIINLFFITQNKNTQTQTETETNLRSLDPISLSLNNLHFWLLFLNIYIYIYIGIECTYINQTLSISRASSILIESKVSLIHNSVNLKTRTTAIPRKKKKKSIPSRPSKIHTSYSWIYT